MLTTLINALDYYLKACKSAQKLRDQRTFFDQAFGACQYHIWLLPADQQEVEELWNCYKPQFEELVYGVV